MQDKICLTLPSLFSETLRKYSGYNAFAWVGQSPVTYLEVSIQIHALIGFLQKLDIKPQDKVAILSTNMPEWGIAFYAVTFMGAVAIPLLPDFSSSEIENILNHSETKALFISKGMLPKLMEVKADGLLTVIGIEDFSTIEHKGENVNFDPQSISINNYHVEEQQLAAIIYTSGTTGNPKGVMLSHKNIASNALQGKGVQPIDENDRFLSILPLSHTYENTLGLILPMISGSCVYYLGKPPTASVLLPALQEVKPTMMLTVPMIIEKIYRTSILPALKKHWYGRLLYKIPVMRQQLNVLAGKKLMQTFGGELKFFGIGGAKLDKKVEEFLREAKFPYAIGYGLTETAPLLAGVNPQTSRLQSTGPAVVWADLKINNPDKVTGEGEIWVKGPNVMKGYYKDPTLTAEVMSEDGWFKTGDLGVFDNDNYLYIKGRLKTIIIGANGENIYPEEIESMINNFQHVLESLVVEKKGKLVALVHFNQQEIEEKYHSLKDDVSNYVERKTEELEKELQHYINSRVNKFSRVQTVISQPKPFQKTPTQKIKRFLYT
ncbi:MAG: AMP-binding protein [Bacteroidetes bacterium]|nr:AMP-binding protein [Bacteroidota bacterium]